VFLLLIDRWFAESDLSFGGNLRIPGKNNPWRIAPRVAVAIISGLMNSTGTSMVMYHQSIDQKERQIAAEKNRQTESCFAEREKDLRERRFGLLIGEQRKDQDTVAKSEACADDASRKLTEATTHLEQDKQEAERELNGAPSYNAGAGPKYRAALDDEKIAQAMINSARRDMDICQERLKAGQAKLDKVDAALQAVEPSIAPEVASLRAERDKEMVEAQNDPLLAIKALGKVIQESGWDAYFLCLLLMGGAMGFEMSYILLKTFNKPASTHDVRMLKEIKLKADEHGADYKRRRESLLADNHASIKPPLRIVDLDPD
jgi:hypothetical protein